MLDFSEKTGQPKKRRLPGIRNKFISIVYKIISTDFVVSGTGSILLYMSFFLPYALWREKLEEKKDFFLY
jgi:FtsH-binding integral membrane protein